MVLDRLVVPAVVMIVTGAASIVVGVAAAPWQGEPSPQAGAGVQALGAGHLARPRAAFLTWARPGTVTAVGTFVTEVRPEARLAPSAFPADTSTLAPSVEATAALLPAPDPGPPVAHRPVPAFPRSSRTPVPLTDELSVYASEHQFYLSSDDPSGHPDDLSSAPDYDFGGLVALPRVVGARPPSSMMVMTGGSDGVVSVEVRPSSTPLPPLATTMAQGWEYAEAVSMRLFGPVEVSGWDGSRQLVLGTPTGEVRVQVFTRGRTEAHYDGVMDASADREHYLVLVGPERAPSPRERAGRDYASWHVEGTGG